MKVIDLFSGAGGFSTGAKMAGCIVIWAGNHWELATYYHGVNHPLATHACQDLQQANWSLVPGHDIMLAAPCCQGHSKARGKESGNPQHDDSRSTAWAVISAVEFHRPPFVLIENVPEFMRWELFPIWRDAMTAMGYTLSPHIIDAADHGVPQHRVRMFMVATRSKAPIQLKLDQREHVAATSFIDFDVGNWTPIRHPKRAKATLRRVFQGRRDLQCGRFLTAYYGNERGGRSIDRPIGTITTRDRWGIVKGNTMRMLSAQECRAAMGFPADYILPTNHREAVHLLGNAVCPPVARDVINALRAAA